MQGPEGNKPENNIKGIGDVRELHERGQVKGLSEESSLETSTPNSRRGFLKGLLGGAVLGTVGMNVGNKYLMEERLHDEYKGKEESIVYINKASNSLLFEMDRHNLLKVKISGTGTEHIEINYYRDFLARFLNSPTGQKYPLRKSILDTGFFTVDNLRVLSDASFNAMKEEHDEYKEETGVGKSI